MTQETATTFRSIAFTIACSLYLAMPGLSVAQPSGSGGGEANLSTVQLSALMTTSTISNIQSVEKECFNRPRPYELDCLREGLELSWRRLPYHGDYGAMRSAIQVATTAIARIVSDNADKALPRLDSGLDANPRFRARRYYTPVLSDKIVAAQASARQALDTLQATLSSNPGKSDEWNQSYGQVAAAIHHMSASLR